MAIVTPTGGKVRWNEAHPLERVDELDFDAMQLLPLEAVADLGGGIRGESTETYQHGLLSRLSYNGTDPAAVSISPFKACYLRPGNGPYDPGMLTTFVYERVTTRGQALCTPATLDFTGRSGTYPYVWARRDQLDYDSANRRFFDDVAEEEFTDTTKTRTRDTVVIGLSNPADVELPPDASTDWVKIARVTSVGSSVTMKPRYAMDRYDVVLESFVPTGGDTVIGGAKFYSELRDSDGPGLAEITTAAFAALAKVHDGRWAVNPATFRLNSAPSVGQWGWRTYLADTAFRGLKQHSDEIDDIDARLTPIESVAGAPAVYVGRVKYNGGTSAYEMTDIYKSSIIEAAINSFSWEGGHLAVITLAMNSAAYAIKAVNIVPRSPYGTLGNLGDLSGAAVWPAVPMLGLSGELPASEVFVNAALVRKGSAGNNDWVVDDGEFDIIVFGSY